MEIITTFIALPHSLGRLSQSYIVLSSFLGCCSLSMATKYIISAVLGSFAISYVCDQLIAEKKIFGGKSWLSVFLKLYNFCFAIAVVWCNIFLFSCSYLNDTAGTTPGTVANKEWWEETDKKFQAWPRTAGPPVVMNPISRQNFIVKSREWRSTT